MHRVLTKPGAEFLELKLFAAHLSTQRVIVVASLVADEVHRFDFLFSFSSSHGRIEGSEFRVQGSASRVVPDPDGAAKSSIRADLFSRPCMAAKNNNTRRGEAREIDGPFTLVVDPLIATSGMEESAAS